MARIRLNNNLVVGINVVTDLDPTSRAFDVAKLHRAFVVITAEKGPVNVMTAVTSKIQFRQVFGGYCNGSYGLPLADIVFDGWGQGIGQKPELYVVRVAGPAASKAQCILKDANSADTWKFVAKNEGEWGNKVQVKVTAGTRTDTVADPGAGPSCAVANTGGTIVAGTYQIVYSLVNDNGETLISQPTSVTVGTGTEHTIAVTAPELPYGASKIQTYVKVGDYWRKSLASADGTKTVTLTAIPTGSTNENRETNNCTVPTRKIQLWYKGNSVGVWDNFQFNQAELDEFNQTQAYLDLVDLDSASVVPENFPAVMAAPAYLSGGNSDNASVDAEAIVGEEDEAGNKTGLKIFRNELLGSGFMAAPGWTDSTVQQELEDQAGDYYRVAVVDLPYDYGVDDVKTWSSGGTVDSHHVLVPYPWRAWANPDASETNSPKRIWVPSSIDIIGAAFKAAINFGPFRAFAGRWFRLPLCPAADPSKNLIGGLMKDIYGNDILNATSATTLGDEYGITCLRNLPGSGPTIYDCVLKTSHAIIKFAPEVLVLNKIYYNMLKSFEASGLEFESLSAVNLNHFFYTCRTLASVVMQSIFDQGGMVGTSGEKLSEEGADAFRVVINEDNNPLSTLQQGIVRIDVYYKNAPIARKIAIHIHPRNLTDMLE